MSDGYGASLRLPAVLSSVSRFQALARDAAQACGLTEEAFSRVDLVLEEILVNIVSYAYPDAGGWMQLDCKCSPEGSLFLEVRDGGEAFNPLDQPDPDTETRLGEREIGGLGIMLVRKMADSVAYSREDGLNVLRFCFNRKSPSEPPGV